MLSGSRTVTPRASSHSISGTATRRLVPHACLAWLSVNGCGIVANRARACSLDARGQHDPLGDPHQLTAAHGGRQLPRTEPRGGEVRRLRCRERVRCEPREHPVHRMLHRVGQSRCRLDDPPLPEDQRRPDDGGQEVRVGQIESPAHHVDRRPGLERMRPPVVRDHGGHLSGELLDQTGGEQPRADAVSALGHRPAHGREVVGPHHAPPGQVGRGVGVGHEVGRPLPGRATTAQLGRGDVQDVGAQHPPGTRITEQQPVPDAQRQRGGEPQPEHRPVQRADPRADGRRTDVDDRFSGDAQRRIADERHVHQVGGPEGAGGQQCVAAGQLLDGHPAEVERHTRGRDRALHRRPEGLHAADGELPRAEQQPVAGGDRASRERAGDDGAGSADREGPVDPQPDGRARVGGRQRGEQLLQRRDQLRQARPGQGAHRHGRHRTHRRRRQAVAHVGQDGRGIGEVGLRHREQRVPDPEGVEDGDVFGGLGGPAVVGRDHHQRGGHRPHPGEHVADEPLVAGDVDDGEPPTGRQRGPGEAEVDGQPAAAFFRPAIGFHARQGADQRRLAVVDVAGGGDHVHGAGVHRAATARTAAARASSDDGGRLRRFSSVRPSSR